MEVKNIYIFCEVYFPDMTSTGYYLTEIAERYAISNNVTVITSGNNKHRNISLRNGVKIIRVPSLSLDNNNLLKRLISYFGVIFFFCRELINLKIKKTSEVIAVTNPAIFLPFVIFLKKKFKFRLTVLAHDIFPEVLIAANILRKRNPFYKMLLYIFNRSYDKVDQIVVLGRDMKLLFKDKIKDYNSIKIITNWADTEIIYPLNNNIETKNNKLIFQYAGNLGRAQGIPNLLSAFSKLDSSKLELHFYGKGVFLNQISSISHENIFYKGSFKRDELNIFLNKCDVSIVTLEKNMLGLGVPSKTYSILCAAKPILYIGDSKSEIALLVKEYKIGYVSEPGDIKSIQNAISLFLMLSSDELKKMKIRCRKLVLENYSKNNVLNKYMKLF